jgi:cell wall-associated NlpC family hydrolase
MPYRRSGLLVPCFLAAALTAAVPAHAQTAAAASTATTTAGKVWSGAQDVAMYALGLIGVNYRFGGNTPDTGLDCSGLVRHVFEEVTGVSLPRTAKEMSALGAKVTPANLQPGDLVFFNTRRFAFSHVGIYLGDNRFVHAPSRGSEVRIAQFDQSYWQKHFNGARRLIGVLPSLAPNVVSHAVASEFTPQALVAAPSPFAFERADLTP